MLHAPLPRTRLFAGGCGRKLDLTAIATRVSEPDLDPAATGELGQGDRGPLDEGDRARPEVVVEQGGVLVGETLQPVEVEVRDRHPPAGVAMANRECRRGD